MSAAGLGEYAWNPLGERVLTDEEAARLRADLIEGLGHRAPVVLGFSQGTPIPESQPRYSYGKADTIHKTGTIDVQISPLGDVEAVWFRCLNLPFTIDRRAESSPYVNPVTEIAIEEITYAELPSEDSSQ